MRFSDLLVRLARNQPLSAVEIFELQNHARAIEEAKDLTKSWVNAGTGTPIFQTPIETIYSQVLNANIATLTIPIPNVYKHLWIFGAGRSTDAGTNYDYLLCQFSGDTATNYTNQKFFASDTSVTASRDSSQTQGIIGLLAQDGRAANDVAAFFSTVPHCSNSTLDKNIVAQMTTAGGIIFLIGTNWNNASPVSSIKFFLSGGLSIKSGSVLSIYGLK